MANDCSSDESMSFEDRQDLEQALFSRLFYKNEQKEEMDNSYHNPFEMNFERYSDIKVNGVSVKLDGQGVSKQVPKLGDNVDGKLTLSAKQSTSNDQDIRRRSGEFDVSPGNVKAGDVRSGDVRVGEVKGGDVRGGNSTTGSVVTVYNCTSNNGRDGTDASDIDHQPSVCKKRRGVKVQQKELANAKKKNNSRKIIKRSTCAKSGYVSDSNSSNLSNLSDVDESSVHINISATSNGIATIGNPSRTYKSGPAPTSGPASTPTPGPIVIDLQAQLDPLASTADQTNNSYEHLKFDFLTSNEDVINSLNRDSTPSDWEYDRYDHARSLRNKNRRDRYFVQNCPICKASDHAKTNCPKLVKLCVICLSKFHSIDSCPSFVCQMCYNPGHPTRYCPQKNQIKFATCTRCNISGHLERSCHEKWRQFHHTTKENILVNTEEMYPVKPHSNCSNCGLEHWSHTCTKNLTYTSAYKMPSPFINKYIAPKGVDIHNLTYDSSNSDVEIIDVPKKISVINISDSESDDDSDRGSNKNEDLQNKTQKNISKGATKNGNKKCCANKSKKDKLIKKTKPTKKTKPIHKKSSVIKDNYTSAPSTSFQVALKDIDSDGSHNPGANEPTSSLHLSFNRPSPVVVIAAGRIDGESPSQVNVARECQAIPVHQSSHGADLDFTSNSPIVHRTRLQTKLLNEGKNKAAILTKKKKTWSPIVFDLDDKPSKSNNENSKKKLCSPQSTIKSKAKSNEPSEQVAVDLQAIDPQSVSKKKCNDKLQMHPDKYNQDFYKGAMFAAHWILDLGQSKMMLEKFLTSSCSEVITNPHKLDFNVNSKEGMTSSEHRFECASRGLRDSVHQPIADLEGNNRKRGVEQLILSSQTADDGKKSGVGGVHGQTATGKDVLSDGGQVVISDVVCDMDSGVAKGVACGVAKDVSSDITKGVASSIASGVAKDVACGVAKAVATGVAKGVTKGVASDVAKGVASGVASGITKGVAKGVTKGVASGVASGVAKGVASGITKGVAKGVIKGVTKGVASGVAKDIASGVAKDVASDVSKVTLQGNKASGGGVSTSKQFHKSSICSKSKHADVVTPSIKKLINVNQSVKEEKSCDRVKSDLRAGKRSRLEAGSSGYNDRRDAKRIKREQTSGRGIVPLLEDIGNPPDLSDCRNFRNKNAGFNFRRPVTSLFHEDHIINDIRECDKLGANYADYQAYNSCDYIPFPIEPVQLTANTRVPRGADVVSRDQRLFRDDSQALRVGDVLRDHKQGSVDHRFANIQRSGHTGDPGQAMSGSGVGWDGVAANSFDVGRSHPYTPSSGFFPREDRVDFTSNANVERDKRANRKFHSPKFGQTQHCSESNNIGKLPQNSHQKSKRLRYINIKK